MRDNQYQRLKQLSEQLTDVAIGEMDSATWAGDGKPLAALTRDERGDRYWCKRNAAATLTMLMKIQSLTGMVERSLLTPPPEAAGDDSDSDLDKEVSRAEKEATRMLNKLQATARARAQKT